MKHQSSICWQNEYEDESLLAVNRALLVEGKSNPELIGGPMRKVNGEHCMANHRLGCAWNMVIGNLLIAGLLCTFLQGSTMAWASAIQDKGNDVQKGAEGTSPKSQASVELSKSDIYLTPVEAEKRIRLLLDKYDSSSEEGQCEAAGDIDSILMYLVNRGKNLGDDMRDFLSDRLIEEFGNIEGDDEPAECKRIHIVSILAWSGNKGKAREFLLAIIDKGPENLRQNVLNGASPRIFGDELYEVFAKAEKEGKIDKYNRLGYQSGYFEKRTRPELEKLLSEEPEKEGFLRACHILNTYFKDKGQTPQNLRIMFRRIRELGIDDTKQWKWNELYWLDGERCSIYLSAAKGEELVVAVEIMSKAGIILAAFDVVLKRGLIGHKDVRVRRALCQWIGPAIRDGYLDRDVARKMLKVRVEKEEDSYTRGILRSHLADLDR